MLAEWRWRRRLAGAFGAMLLASGCASAPARPAARAQFVEPSRESDCEESARTTAGGTGTWTDIASTGMLGTILGALRGALEGAVSSTWRGTRAGHDSWIGAAAGAGAGMIAGTVMGIRRAREAQSAYLVAYHDCMVEAAPIDSALLTEDGARPAYKSPPSRP